MSEADHDHAANERVSPDLVQYLIVVVPEPRSIADVIRALDAMVDASTIAVLDVVAVVRAAEGTVTASELDTIMPRRGDRAGAAQSHELLSAHDVELAAFAVPPGATGLIVVIEDRWAAPLSRAAARVGGHIVAGELIPRRRVELALADTRPSGSETE